MALEITKPPVKAQKVTMRSMWPGVALEVRQPIPGPNYADRLKVSIVGDLAGYDGCHILRQDVLDLAEMIKNGEI